MNACEKCVFAVYDDNPHCGLRGFRSNFNVEYCSAENDTIPNGYELQKDGYFSWVNKKKDYPKTYEECCEVLSIPSYYKLRYYTYEHGYTEYATSNKLCSLSDKLNILGKLLICRDAYWKLYSEEMGLGKPWQPDWTNHELKYCIKVLGNTLECVSEMNIQCVLAFPTAEMRDSFKKNFDPDIEICKEFL